MLRCMAVTTKARHLGARLRAARLEAGHESLPQFSELLGKDRSTVYRWESGERTPNGTDVTRYLMTLGVSNEVIDELVTMVRDADDSVWVSRDKQSRDQQMSALLDLEQDAHTITEVSPTLIPGLLQTSDYARAIMRAATRAGVAEQEVNTRVTVRVGRSNILTRRVSPVHFRAFLGEAALRRQVGGVDVLRHQLEQVLERMKLDTVELRVIPDSRDWTPADEGNFVLLEPANGEPPQGVVHTENRLAGLFFHEDDDVAQYRQGLAVIETAAMSPGESAELIVNRISALERS